MLFPKGSSRRVNILWRIQRLGSDTLADMSDTDLELLARYATRQAEDAFAELVRRHLNLVYSAALRQVRSPQLAEEVAQSAFVDLARNAARLRPDTILTAWLYQVTRRTAIDVVRREASRQLREQIATEMNAMNATAADWTHIEPLLDEAMHALDETDRAAVLLRYFENKSLREVGQALGASENAAQKRLSRAIESLREFFAKRGVTVGASGLLVVLTANAVQAAPVGLAVTVSTTAALAGATIATTSIGTATKAIALTTLHKSFVAAALVAAVGTAIYEAHQISVAYDLNASLQQQQSTLTDQIGQLIRERDTAVRGLTAVGDETSRLDQSTRELLRLRANVASLTQELASLKEQARKAEERFQSATNAWALDEIKRVGDWKDMGLSSPEAAVATYWWAMAGNNALAMKDSIVFERGIQGTPVTDIYAKREARSQHDRIVAGKIGGIGLRSIATTGSLSSGLPGRAKIEIDVYRQVEPGDNLPPAPGGRPAWFPEKESYELMMVDGKWKVIVAENAMRLSLDDEDRNAVATMLLKMAPEAVQEIRSKIPAETWRIYEELSASRGK